ncbi:protein of unknown function DUF177 [Thermocrinis albus DSM 14484]|uniref:DUF177 domain-containing protein n=1 Tax=Thermocrinis albus (strain DSM 14484 / JCM 11386 / HI 11/12) TaxID=638303 RepID=D3SNT2_THEAH|nr:YceD family protein [Thermocrinis albus]ADC88819.1 protein of unknown function DUF177 [Thermocrinis albus DSM 14484]
MVILNLKEIFKRSNRFTGYYRLSPSEIKLPADIGEITKPVEVQVEITKERGGYRLHLHIQGEVTLECSRCLQVYQKDISGQEVIRLERYPEEHVIHIRPQDLNVSFYEDEEAFDLVSLVREQIILSIPTKPLCDPNCEGIPYQKEEESPFASLKNLLKK